MPKGDRPSVAANLLRHLRRVSRSAFGAPLDSNRRLVCPSHQRSPVTFSVRHPARFSESLVAALRAGGQPPTRHGQKTSRELAFAIRWDLSAVPEKAPIQQAILELLVANESMESDDKWRVNFFHVYEYPAYQIAGQKWSQGNCSGGACQGSDLCWNTRPTTGIQMNASPLDWQELAEPPKGSTTSFDVTNVVQEAVDMGESSVTLLVMVERLSGGGGLDEVAFRSKEHSAAPSLAVTYSVP